MAEIIYIESDGSRHRVDVEEGMTLMEGAQLNMVPGIEAVCGGLCSCATCHVWLDDNWLPLVEPRAKAELEMLKKALQRRASSRLSCQITVTAEMEGKDLIVEIPPEQAA